MKFENAKILVASFAFAVDDGESESCIDVMYEYSKNVCKNDITRSRTTHLPSYVRSRNSAIDFFMSGDWKSILFVDNEYIFDQRALEFLFLADKDIIAGVSTDSQNCLADTSVKRKPLVYYWENKEVKQYTEKDLLDRITTEKYEPFEVPHINFGMVLIKRRVFEGLTRPYFFDSENIGIENIDRDFCKRATDKGFKCFVYPIVNLIRVGKGYTGMSMV